MAKMQQMRRVRTVFILIRHYDHLPNVVSFPPFFCQNRPRWGMDSTRPLNMCWRCDEVFVTKMSPTNTLSCVSCEVASPWICLIYPGHPTDARLNWVLGNLKVKSMLQSHCCAPGTIPKPVLLCGRARYPAERVHSHDRIQFPWKDVHGLQQCL